MATEKSLQQWTKRACKDYDILCCKFASPGRRGVPDLLLVRRGGVFFIELKTPTGTGRLSDLQVATIAEMRDHGATVYVCASMADVLGAFRQQGLSILPKHRRMV
jgi:hypothetical protein